MKILFFTNDLNANSGYSRYCLDLSEAMQEQRHQVLCLTCKSSNQSKITEKVVLKDTLVYLVNLWQCFLTSFKVKKVIKNFQPDIIHFIAEPYANLLPFILLDRILKPGFKKPKTFITICGTYSYIPNVLGVRMVNLKKLISKYLTQYIYHHINGIVVISHFTKNYVMKYIDKKLENKMRVISTGLKIVDENVKLDFKTQVKIDNKIKKILFVGAIKSRKGLLEAVQSIAYYRHHFSNDFIFNIIGSYNQKDVYYQEVIQTISKYHLEEFVFLKGSVLQQELEKYYQQSDLYLMLSKTDPPGCFEGLGIVYFEANLQGVPCIGAKNSGAQDAVLDGKTGYLVDANNPKQVAEKIDLILNKKTINPQDCIEWAKKNDVRLKAKEILNYYQQSMK